MVIISRHLSHFFLLQLNPKCMKRILHLVSVKNIMSKFSYNWFKIDILRLLRPLTAIFSHVHGHLNYYIYIIQSSNNAQNVFWQLGSDCSVQAKKNEKKSIHERWSSMLYVAVDWMGLGWMGWLS